MQKVPLEIFEKVRITFFMKDFFSKYYRFCRDLVTFNKEIFNGKCHFLFSVFLDVRCFSDGNLDVLMLLV